MIGVVIALVMVGGSYWFSDKLALKSAKAVVITESDAPEFYRMVQSLAQRANMPMPRVAISPAEQPNAFATGRGPNNAVVCATQGLLRSMPADELEGVMAHELMHVRNRDILIGSVAAAVATAISAIAQMAYFAALFGGGRDDEDRPNPAVQPNFLARDRAWLAPCSALNSSRAALRCKLLQPKLRRTSITHSPSSVSDALVASTCRSCFQPTRAPTNVFVVCLRSESRPIRGKDQSPSGRLWHLLLPQLQPA